jgi:hypothetical protein
VSVRRKPTIDFRLLSSLHSLCVTVGIHTRMDGTQKNLINNFMLAVKYTSNFK